MGLETGTYVSDLISSNPLATDAKSQGDDHLRLIKAVVKATFPNASKKFYFPNGASTQTSDVTVTSADDNKMFPVNCQAASRSLTLPLGSSVWDGFTVRVCKADHSNNVLTVSRAGSDAINSGTSIALWQRYQTAVFRYFTALSGWIAEVAYIPPIGEITPHSANNLPTGAEWVLLNATTIGNASSGAGQKADAACRGLFYHLWTQYSNTVCPVSGGRGSSAQADFDANKTITLPDLRGRTWVGLDDMAASAAGRIGNVISGTTNGSTGGAERQLIAQANLPDISPTISITDPGHSHTNTGAAFGASSTGFSFNLGGSTGAPTPPAAISFGTAFTGITATASSINGSVSQTYLGNVQPSMVGSWKMKL